MLGVCQQLGRCPEDKKQSGKTMDGGQQMLQELKEKEKSFFLFCLGTDVCIGGGSLHSQLPLFFFIFIFSFLFLFKSKKKGGNVCNMVRGILNQRTSWLKVSSVILKVDLPPLRFKKKWQFSSHNLVWNFMISAFTKKWVCIAMLISTTAPKNCNYSIKQSLCCLQINYNNALKVIFFENLFLHFINELITL